MIFKVNLISKRTMVNDQHNALMGECMKHLDKVTTENAKYKEAYDAFKAAFEVEEKYYKLGTKNPYTESLNKESKYRVFLYNGLRQYLELQISVGFATSASAQKVLDLLDLFKAEMKKNVMGQGAAMRNILTSLAEEEYQTALTETNATFFYTKLGEADKKVEELLVAYRAFNRDWMAEALKKARQRMDEAYDEMANCLNGGAVMFGEPFITAIKDWNSSIDAFKLSKKRSDAMRKKANETEAKPGAPNANQQPKPDGNQTADPNANPKPGQEGNAPQDPNAPKPDNPNDSTEGKPSGDTTTGDNTHTGTNSPTQGGDGNQSEQNNSNSIITPAVPEKQNQATK